MRINSHFKDYYDGVQALGHDDSLVYMRYRKTHEVRLNTMAERADAMTKWVHLVNTHAPDFDASTKRFDRIIIGFCGELFQVVRHREFHWVEGVHKEKGRRFFYDSDSFRKAFPGLDEGMWFNWLGRKTNYPELGSYDNDDEPFVAIKAPVFALEYGENVQDEIKVHINPCLKDYEFVRIKSDFEAYQELEMYLGNVLVNAGPEPQPVSDLGKVISHGFDPKMGFRKRKKQ